MRRSKLKNNFLSSSFFTREISFHTRETQIKLPLRILLKLLAFHNRRRPNESKPNSPPPPYNSSIRSRKKPPFSSPRERKLSERRRPSRAETSEKITGVSGRTIRRIALRQPTILNRVSSAHGERKGGEFPRASRVQKHSRGGGTR